MISPVKAIVFVIFVLVLQQIEGNLIYPKVVGKSIGLPGIWVLLSVTCFCKNLIMCCLCLILGSLITVHRIIGCGLRRA